MSGSESVRTVDSFEPAHNLGSSLLRVLCWCQDGGPWLPVRPQRYERSHGMHVKHNKWRVAWLRHFGFPAATYEIGDDPVMQDSWN